MHYKSYSSINTFNFTPQTSNYFSNNYNNYNNSSNNNSPNELQRKNYNNPCSTYIKENTVGKFTDVKMKLNTINRENSLIKEKYYNKN